MTNTVSRTISDETLSRIVQIESAGKPTAKASTSSATGLGQFLNGTWLDELKRHRPDLFNGPPYDDELALRTDPTIAIEMLARFTEENAKALGTGYEDGDLYLAHFAGAGTAKKLLRAEEDTPTTEIFTPAAIKANKSILAGKTAGQVRAWAGRRMAASGKVNWVEKLYRGKPVGAAAPHGETTPDIEAVQKDLEALGYFEVGDVDGKWGGRTAAAIAAFKNDRKLDGDPIIDKALKRSLAEAKAEGFSRPIATARKDASEDKVAEVSDAIPASKESGVLAWILGIPAAALSAFSGIASYFRELWDSDIVTSLREFASENIGLLAGGVALFAGYQWYKAKKAKDAVLADYRSGRLT